MSDDILADMKRDLKRGQYTLAVLTFAGVVVLAVAGAVWVPGLMLAAVVLLPLVPVFLLAGHRYAVEEQEARDA